jgi:hypothetical protein
MKKIILVFVIASAFQVAGSAQTKDNTSVLMSVIKKLNFDTPLDTLKETLMQMKDLREHTKNSYIDYWEAYAQYLLYFKVKSDEKLAIGAIEDGMKLLENSKKQSSDHYALLSLLEGLDIAYSSSLTVPFKSAKSEKNAEKAIELDSNNLRGYYALAIKDYYTPALYGGGKLVEANLLKAISLADKSDANPFAPTWGKDDAYWYLVRFYNKNKQPELGKKYLFEGLEKYPDHYGLNQVKKKLIK